MLNKNLESNIRKYYIISILQGLWFILSINIIYWKSFGISYEQIGIFEFLGALTIILLEIPTGAVADLISRKMSFFIGVLLSSIANLMIGLGSSLYVFGLAFVVWAIGDTFISGAKSALIYDSLKDLNREKEYLKVQSKFHFISSVSLIIATIISPHLYLVNRRLPYVFLGISWLISSFIILTMTEPSRASKKYNLKNHIAQMKNGFKYSLAHKAIRWYFLFGILIGLPMSLYNDLISQTYYLSLGFSIASLSFLIPLIYGSAGLTAGFASKIEEKLGEKKSLIVSSLIPAVSFLLMGLLKIPFVIAFVLLLYMSRDFRGVVLDNYVNKHIPSKMRATIISIGSMSFNFVALLAYPFAGKLMDVYGIIKVIFVFGIFLIISIALLFKANKGLVFSKDRFA
jgi:MFS family permease